MIFKNKIAEVKANIILIIIHVMFMISSFLLADFLHPSFGKIISNSELFKLSYSLLINEEYFLLSCSS